MQEDLQSVRPLDVEVASFAEVVNRTLSPPPAISESSLAQLRYSETGAFYIEQCFQTIEVVAEQFIASSHIKKRR